MCRLTRSFRMFLHEQVIDLSFRGRDRLQTQGAVRELVAAWIESNPKAATKVEALIRRAIPH
jgi:hypothetical protein